MAALQEARLSGAREGEEEIGGLVEEEEGDVERDGVRMWEEPTAPAGEGGDGSPTFVDVGDDAAREEELGAREDQQVREEEEGTALRVEEEPVQEEEEQEEREDQQVREERGEEERGMEEDEPVQEEEREEEVGLREGQQVREEEEGMAEEETVQDEEVRQDQVREEEEEEGVLLEEAAIQDEERRSDTMAVCVLHPRGDPFTVFLLPSATVGELKMRVEQEVGYPAPEQRLVYNDATPSDESLLAELQQASPEPGLMVQLVVPIRLTLHLYTGPVLSLQVPSNENVQVLRSAVYDRGGIPYHLQKLMYDGRVLQPGHRLSEYSVRDGATIVVELSDYEVMVFFKTLTGETIMLRVSPRDTVGDVKRKIAAQEEIPAEKQRLIFVGEQMDDRRRLFDYRVEHESAVHLVLRHGDSFQVFVDATPTRTHIFEMDASDRVVVIKEQLQEKEGVLVCLQRLLLGERELRDDDTLEESGVGPNTTLRFAREEGRDTQIFVGVPRNDRFSVWVKPEDTVRFVKEMVALRERVPVEKQELYFARRRLDNDRTLQSYYIEANHMLHMEIITPKILHIVARTQDEGEDVVVEIPEDLTVSDLKTKIEQQEEIPRRDLQLFLAGAELEDEQVLQECGLGESCTLDLVCSRASLSRQTRGPVPLVLFVKTLTGQTISLTIQPTDTVLDLKKQIKEKEGIPESQQCLVVAGRQLEDGESISSCGVQNQSVLHLVLRVPSQETFLVEVEEGNGRSFSVSVVSSDTVDQLKAKIAERGGGEGEWSLAFEGQTLEDGSASLSSCGITNGSSLQLQHQ